MTDMLKKLIIVSVLALFAVIALTTLRGSENPLVSTVSVGSASTSSNPLGLIFFLLIVNYAGISVVVPDKPSLSTRIVFSLNELVPTLVTVPDNPFLSTRMVSSSYHSLWPSTTILTMGIIC